ncbi:smoothelin-like protein 1 [Taeniopygia guttata]|uniref:smoothelin-like protein 1 n=1 Tax=Taeniopygia guttata TaxID=59729 RepID=UPI003BB93903
MEALGDAETPTSDTPTSDTPTSDTPTPGTPTLDTPTASTPTPGTPTASTSTSDTPTLGTPTRGSPTPDTPSDPAAGPGESSGEATAPRGGEEAREAGGDAGDTGGEGKNTGGEGEDTGGSGGCAGEEAAGDGGAEAPRSAGGDAGEAGDGGGDAKAGTAGGTGAGTEEGTEEGTEGKAAPAATGNTRRQKEPTWLQDEDDELWPEFPPCSSPEGAASPTSPTSPTSPMSPMSPTSPISPVSPASPAPPTAGTAEDTGGSKRGAPAGGTRDKAAPGSAGQRLRLEGAGGRPRVGTRAQGRSAILEKFGGAAKGPAPHLRRSGGAATVKTMLLEWCRARTRGYPHVDVQNFSGSWGSGLAFCALLHSFFPDAFDFATLEPNARRDNFALAFATAEERAGCAPLLEVEDMVRLPVPDAKCVYTYVQELYRCLVAKGLVKTKKR